jgi:hypothetical protein
MIKVFIAAALVALCAVRAMAACDGWNKAAAIEAYINGYCRALQERGDFGKNSFGGAKDRKKFDECVTKARAQAVQEIDAADKAKIDSISHTSARFGGPLTGSARPTARSHPERWISPPILTPRQHWECHGGAEGYTPSGFVTHRRP